EGSNDDVSVAVAIDVSSAADREAEVGEFLIALGCPRGGLEEARRRTVVDEDAPFVLLSIVTAGAPDDHIVIAIAVHVSSCPRGHREVGAGLVALRHP